MAATPRHGKSASLWIDSTAGSLINLSSGLTDLTLSRSMDPADVTNFASGGNKNYIPGLKGATLSFSGNFSSTHAEKLDGMFADSDETTFSIEFSPDGSTASGRHLLKAEVWVTSLEYGASVSDKVNMSGEFLISGALTSTNH